MTKRLVCVVALWAGMLAGQWKVVGPGGGGAQYFPTVSPHDSNKVLAACDMTGAYLSEDGGASWRMFNLRNVTKEFVWDPKNDKVLFARGRALFRSTDGGRKWRLVYPAESRLSGVDMANDHADETLQVGGQAAPAMTAFTTDGKRWTGAFGARVESSTDGGASWSLEKEFGTSVRKVWMAGEVVYAAEQQRVWRKEGALWKAGAELPAAWVDIAGAGRMVYAVTAKQVFVSKDGGMSWAEGAVPGAGGKFTAAATTVAAPGTAYVGFGQRKVGERVVFGVAKTVDGGATWTLPWAQGTENPEYVKDAWITPSLGADWGDEPLTLGVAPKDANVVYATDLGRTLRSRDGGRMWEAVYSKKAGDGFVSTGLDVTTAYGIHHDPFDSKRMLISYTDIGQELSEDGGKTWRNSLAGVPRPWINTTYWMVFDPAVKGRVWGGTSATHDLPRPKMWRRASPSRYVGGVILSEDGGRTWKASNGGMAPSAVTHVVLDERSPKDARVLYATAFGRGVYKSTDGGKNWVLKRKGLEGEEPFAWRLALDGTGGLYLVVARRSEDGRIGDWQDGALYYSADGAENWKELALPEGLNGPNGLTVNGRKLFLSAWARKNEPRVGGKGGIWVSEDEGGHWRQVFSGDQHVYDVTVDPRNPKRLFACGFESSAWRSDDGGESWARIGGYNFKWGQRVMVDPLDERMIYVLTFGGSVWHGPAAGGGDEDLMGAYAPGR